MNWRVLQRTSPALPVTMGAAAAERLYQCRRAGYIDPDAWPVTRGLGPIQARLATMAQPGNLPNAEYRRFEGMREYEAVIDSLIPLTQQTIRIFDRSLSARYNSPQRQESLRRFLLAGRLNRLLIVVHDAGKLDRECPRVLQLLQQFSYAVSIRETLAPARHVYDPFAIFDASHYVHRFHYDHLRAAQGTNDVLGAQQLLDRFGEIWEASAPAASANVTGL